MGLKIVKSKNDNKQKLPKMIVGRMLVRNHAYRQNCSNSPIRSVRRILRG